MDPAQEFWTIDPEGSPMFVRVVSQPDSGMPLYPCVQWSCWLRGIDVGVFVDLERCQLR